MTFVRKLTARLGLFMIQGSLLALTTSSLVFTHAVKADSGQEALMQATNALRSIDTLQANFMQTDRNGQTVTGYMTLKKGGKIRFEYGDEQSFLVISTGQSLYLIDYEVNQVERWPIGDSPLSVLLDSERDISRFGTVVYSPNPEVITIEVRDPQKPEFGMISLIFVRKRSAPGGWQLSSWVALDAQNHRTTVRLDNHVYGLEVPDSAFRFRDPRQSSRRPR